jgi:tRNA threonylcarbamoyladenosine biosynthesis protein TsaB
LALLRDEEVLQIVAHEETGDYSSWVLPAAEKALASAGLAMSAVEVYAVATGPGSFTGVRIALTTVKAWSEAYGNGIAAISRLEAMASLATAPGEHVAAFFDAHREQIYGGLYRRDGATLVPIESELVAAPADFLEWVSQRSRKGRVSWISLDPEKLTTREVWQERAAAGETVELSPNALAPAIGRIGRKRALEGRLTDALLLDAEYVRRPDAEVNWKPGALRGG